MEIKLTIKYEILSESDSTIEGQRESGITHSSFESEIHLYTSIENGNVEEVEKAVKDYVKKGVVVGRLSQNNSRQMLYWAISCISIGVHYAIKGGLDETAAYNLSDVCIRQLDTTQDFEQCMKFLLEFAIKLTTMVKESNLNPTVSNNIKKSLHYINIHLHENIQIIDIADEISISKDYLSKLFKKEMGISIHKYILDEKLKEAKLMLISGYSSKNICYTLGFCSETHFISLFKKKYNITPKQFSLSYIKKS